MVTKNPPRRTPAGNALTTFVLELFRVNSILLTTGDRLVASLGLTSARWQILGAISSSESAQPVAWLARNLGANRQNVQRIINDLSKEGLVTFEPNPHHRRAQLVVLTDKGRQRLDATIRLQVPWINSVARGLEVDQIKAAHHVIAILRKTLEGNGQPDNRERVVRSRDIMTNRNERYPDTSE
jgi:DNA-binding MarR family transcriptional regulator